MNDDYENPDFIERWEQFLEDVDTVVKVANEFTYLFEPTDGEDDLYQLFTSVVEDLEDPDTLKSLDRRINEVEENVIGYLSAEMKMFEGAVSDFSDWLPDDPREKLPGIIDRIKDLLGLAQTIKDSLEDLVGGLPGQFDIFNELLKFFKAIRGDDANENNPQVDPEGL